MAKITAAEEMSFDGLGVPEEDWIKAWNDQQSCLGRQLVSAFRRNITVADNTTSLSAEYDLVHGQSVTVSNPLGVPIQAIYAIGCVGLETGSDGKPNGGVYDLAIPEIVAKPSTKPDGSWVVTAYFSADGQDTGYVGETIGPITRLRSNAVGLTTGTPANVCTTASLAITPGTWMLYPQVGFETGAGTSVTRTGAAVSATSAALPANDTTALPTGGETQAQIITGSAVPGSGIATVVNINPYEVTVADGATLPLFLVARAAFSGGTLSAFGSMKAIRSKPYMTGRRGRVKLFFFGG